MRLLIGVIIGVLLCYYFPREVGNAVEQVEEAIHEGASRAADATRPDAVQQLRKMVE